MASSPRQERTDYAVSPWGAKPGLTWTRNVSSNLTNLVASFAALLFGPPDPL